MDSKNCKIVSCSKKKKKESSLPFLSEEVIFNVLIWLPADVLYNVMRYVCRVWYNIIKNPDFIQSNLLHSNPGAFIHRYFDPDSAFFAEVREYDIWKTNFRFCFPYRLCASCDGLLLCWSMSTKGGVFYIANPVTKQQVLLPPLPVDFSIFYKSALVYAPSLRRYKVVHAYRKRCVELFHRLVVLTVGADKEWRLINIEHTPPTARSELMHQPISAGKFVYWAAPGAHYLMILDVESEEMKHLPDPGRRGGVVGKNHCYGALGNNLCLMDMVETFKLQVWVLDLKLGGGEWTKLHNLNFSGVRWSVFGRMRRNLDSTLFPSLWLRNGEVVVFIFENHYGSTAIVSYNVKTRLFFSCDIALRKCTQWMCVAHVNSLVSLDSSSS